MVKPLPTRIRLDFKLTHWNASKIGAQRAHCTHCGRIPPFIIRRNFKIAYQQGVEKDEIRGRDGDETVEPQSGGNSGADDLVP